MQTSVLHARRSDLGLIEEVLARDLRGGRAPVDRLTAALAPSGNTGVRGAVSG